jgi:prepilin-type processing-associated H-X9-DG protein
MTHNGKGNILLVDKARNGNVVLALFKDLNNNTYHLRFYVLKNNINYDTNSHRSSNIYNHPFINNSFNFNNHHNNGCNNSSEGEA